MKTLTLITIALLLSFNLAAQSDSIIVSVVVDEMTDKEYYLTSKDLLATNDNIKGVSIMVITNNKVMSSFAVKSYSMGSKCNENSTLIFLYSDGTKTKLKSWNKYSCKTSYFTPTAEMITKLKTLEVEKIYFQNGTSLESGTFIITEKRYFIQVLIGLENL